MSLSSVQYLLQCYPVPYLHQELNQHLPKLRGEGFIEDVNHRESMDCILLLPSVRRRIGRNIRLNLDAWQLEIWYRMKRLFGSMSSTG